VSEEKGWVRKTPQLYVDGHVTDKKNIGMNTIDIT
jgi:prepilin-type processing-associated H-X9-DG protein